MLSPDERWAAELRDRILADCHPRQRDAVLDPSTRISYLVGRGGAKTTSMRARALIKCTSIKNGIVKYVANSRQHARELMWDPLKRACEQYGIFDDMYFLDSMLSMRCRRTDAVYQLFGVEERRDADKFRGFPPDEIQLDEVGGMDPGLLDYLIDECLAGRIGERHGAIVIGSTPPARQAGTFYDATRYGAVDADGVPLHRPYADRDKPEFANWIRWSSHAWTLEEVVKLPDADKLYPALVANWTEALINKRRKGWADDHPIWMREWLGQWAASDTDRVFRYRPFVDGAPWNRWSPYGDRKLEGISMLRESIAALPKDVGAWHFVVDMDMGSRDPFACNAFAFAPRDPQRRIFHVFAFEKTGMYSKLIAEILIGPEAVERCMRNQPGEPYAGVFGLTGWPDATTIDADQATIDELANVYGIGCRKAERKADYKFGAVELVNGDLIEGRIKILEGSPLEIQLQILQWKADQYGLLREDKGQANHSTDTMLAARIDIANLFESGAVANDVEQAKPVQSDPFGRGPPAEDREPDLQSLLAEPEFDDAGAGGWP